MKPIEDGVWQFRLLWPNAFNVYYIQGDGEGIVVDASTRWSWGYLRKQLNRSHFPVTGVVLTHAHPDHQGCADKICRAFHVPLACHHADVESAEGKAPLVRHSRFFEALGNLFWAGPRTCVERPLREGDRVAGFTVYHMPGHTHGQITLFRERDRVAIVGDVINTNDYLTGMFSIVREPPRVFSVDPAMNRESIRRLWSLHPRVICAGHGPVLRDMGLLERFVSKLN